MADRAETKSEVNIVAGSIVFVRSEIDCRILLLKRMIRKRIRVRKRVLACEPGHDLLLKQSAGRKGSPGPYELCRL